MKKIVMLLLSAILVMSCLSGCKPGNEGPGGEIKQNKPGNESSLATSEENISDVQVVKTMYSDELSDWNPMHPSSGNEYANWIDTLVEYDNFGIVQPCLAESWTREEFEYDAEEEQDDGTIKTVKATGQSWVFKIREGVKWQTYDGAQYEDQYVKAEDWVTTIKWILDPRNTARTADLLFDIIGAYDYYNTVGSEDPAVSATADFNTVGVKALSDYEIEFRLEAPCPYFLSRLTYNWGFPTNAKFLEEMGDQFGTDNTTILYCGAYLCSEWEQNAYTTNVRNPEYWDIEDIHIERIEARFNAEANTIGPEAFLRGEITSASIPTTQVDAWKKDPEKAKLIHPVRASAYPHFYLVNFKPTYKEGMKEGYELNHKQWLKAANNVNFRKALFYGLDRIKAITCYDPYTPENFELRSITPPNFCSADGKDFTQFDCMLPFTSQSLFQPNKALEYRDKAKAELEAAGVKLPIVAYMPYQLDTDDVEMSIVVSQQLEELLGTDFIKFILEGYPPTDYLAITRRAGNYSFMTSYWGPDYADPETYTDPFALGQAYNYIWHADGFATRTDASDPDGRMGRSGYDETYWKDSAYDNLVAKGQKETVDVSKRYHAFAEAEAWLLDQAFVIPLGLLHGTGYIASNMNPFESQFASFGLSVDRYKYQVVMKQPMDTETYLAGLEVWEKERNERIAKLQAQGLDY